MVAQGLLHASASVRHLQLVQVLPPPSVGEAVVGRVGPLLRVRVGAQQLSLHSNAVCQMSCYDTRHVQVMQHHPWLMVMCSHSYALGGETLPRMRRALPGQ